MTRNLTFGPYRKLPPLIPAIDHASAADETAQDVSEAGFYMGREIYRVNGGYVALIGDKAFDCVFPSRQDAKFAQDCYDAVHSK